MDWGSGMNVRRSGNCATRKLQRLNCIRCGQPRLDSRIPGSAKWLEVWHGALCCTSIGYTDSSYLTLRPSGGAPVLQLYRHGRFEHDGTPSHQLVYSTLEQGLFLYRSGDLSGQLAIGR